MDLQVTEKEGKWILNTEALETAIRQSTIDAVKAKCEELVRAETRAIFDNSDGRTLETKDGSVIDMSYFNPERKLFGKQVEKMDGAELGSRLASAGGPFLKISPAMEEFAMMVRLRFRPQSIIGAGLNVKDYNQRVIDWNGKILNWDQKAIISVTTLAEADVGALVPIEFLATVIEFAVAASKILPQLWRIPMGWATTRIPQLAQTAGSYFGGILLYHPDEAYEKTATKPAFTYKTLEAKKLIGLIPVTDELVMDSSINIINYLTGLFTRAFQYGTEGEVIAGTGLTGQMLGIVNDPGINLVGRQTVGTVKRDDVINLESAIDENFENLSYITRRLTLNTLRKQKITGSDQPIYFDTTLLGLETPIPAQLNGYPVIKTRNVPAMGSKGDLICGELGYYLWGIRQDMTIDMSAERWFEYDVKALRFVVRQDGLPGVSIAFAILDSAPES